MFVSECETHVYDESNFDTFIHNEKTTAYYDTVDGINDRFESQSPLNNESSELESTRNLPPPPESMIKSLTDSINSRLLLSSADGECDRVSKLLNKVYL